MSGLPKEYRGLMREALNSNEDAQQRPLKRRKRGRKNNDMPRETPEPVLDLTIEESESPREMTPRVDRTVEVDVDVQDTPEPKPVFTKEVGDDDDDEDDWDDADFEDVDLENVQVKASRMLKEDVVLTVEKEEPKKKTRKANIISKEERDFRKNFHRCYLASMMIHGALRNKWCNNEGIHNQLKKLITVAIYDELHPPRTQMQAIRTRKFLDGLRHLMEKWCKHYKVTSNKGIFKHDWYDWKDIKRSPTDFARFQRCLIKGRGTRDIGAQGFVALLRAADVPSRLVFSLQPPDFTDRRPRPQQNEVKEEKKDPGPTSMKDKVLALRKGKTSLSKHKPSSVAATQAEIEMEYPVFWAEAWDNASKTWITIDPIMFKLIENVKYKSKLEPKLSYPYNTLTYVIGYDRGGGVKDITKRYAEKYYSKTRKKRITKEESEEIWYSGFIDALSARPRTKADDYEDEYFAKRAEQEGMPDNIQDFKGHPFYVLESQLRANEVLHPKESCGMIRVKGKNDAIPVYKRSNVQYLRSPRAWYQRGRILKPGVQPMKTRQKTSMQMARNLDFGDDDEDKEERLYAESQTELYVPPPATDGLIEKNAYGNIDVFVPSMIPEGAVLINTEFAEDAAKVLGIDYAPAVVGFKFDRRQATPKIGGVVVGKDFKEAMEVVQEQLKVEAAEKERIQLEIRALKGWNLLLTKLRIKQRLDKSHGKLEEDAEVDSDAEYERLQKEYEEYMENDESEYEEAEREPSIGAGGFLAEDAVWDPNQGSGDDDAPVSDRGVDTGAGFFMDEDEEPKDTGAGFFAEDDDGFEDVDTGAGFIAEDDSGRAGPVAENEDEDTGAGFMAEDADAEAEFAAMGDDMDDYEAFMNGLGEIQDDEDGEEDEQELVESGEESEPKEGTVPETAQKVTETVDSDSDTDEPAPTPLRVVVVPSKEPVKTETAPESKEPTPLIELSSSSSEEPEVVTTQELEHDDELEKEFNEQLQQEQHEASEADVYDVEDDDFEYASD